MKDIKTWHGHGQETEKVGYHSSVQQQLIFFLLQLRYLQTLNSISAEHNSTIIFPVPIDIVSNFMNYSQQNNQDGGGLDAQQQQQQYQQFLEYQQQHQTMQAHHQMPQVSGYLDLDHNVIDIPLICTNTIYMEIPLSPRI